MHCEAYLVGRIVYKVLQKKSSKKYYNGFPLPWAPPFSYQTTALALSQQNLLDHVSAVIRPWKLYFGDLDLYGPFAIFFLTINQSDPRTSSATNQRSYNALGQLPQKKLLKKVS